MINIKVNNISYDRNAILQSSAKSLTSFEQNTLSFLRQWLSGQEHFELTTSGSTGTPKPIQLHRKQLIASARLTIETLGLTKGMTALLCLDPHYIAGKMMIVRCLEGEMNLVAIAPSPNPFENLQTDQLVDFAAFVPYQIQSILKSPERSRFNQLKTALIGGAPLDQSTRIELLNYSCSFYETYGMTETISHVALRKVSELEVAFKALPGITLQQDNRGCLVIEADHILQQRVVTNDLVEMGGPSKFRWIGRWDNVINSGGIKILPEKVEEKIKDIFNKKGVTSAFFVAGMPHPQLGEALVLVIENDDHETGQLNEWLQVLDRFERPKSIHFISPFVFTETGKINRKETLKKLLS